MSYPDYNNNFTQSPKQPNNQNNTGLIVTISILASVVVIALIFVTLLVTGVISFGGSSEQTAVPVTTQTESAPQVTTSNEVVSAPSPEPQPIPVQRTMYIDCNVSLTMRTGPSTSNSEICQVPTGSSVYVIEYTNNEFARITYNGYEGYVMKQYLSDTQPYVWHYSESEVESFVAGSLRGYVNAINTGDTSFVYDYYSGSIVQSELASIESNSKAAAREELLSVNCHSVNRISKTQVSVIRESTIRVYYYDGAVKDVVEKYKYTVDGSSGRMFITALNKA